MVWFIIRHGETLHNLKNIVQGHYPSMLTLKGIDQIKSIGYRLLDTGENFRNYKLITSPMARTKHSMQILQEIIGLTDMKYTEEPLISEVDTGHVTNMEEEMTKIKYPHLWSSTCYLERVFPGGESNLDMCIRVEKFMDKYKDGENLVIVTHSGICRWIRNFLLGRKREELDELRMGQNYFFMWDGKKLETL